MTVKELIFALEEHNGNETVLVQGNFRGQTALPIRAAEFADELSSVIIFPDWNLAVSGGQDQ